MSDPEDRSALYHLGSFFLRHAGEICKTYVLSLAAFGALYVDGLTLLASFLIATGYAVALILLFTFRGEKALSVAAWICTGGLLVFHYVMRESSPYSPIIAPLFISIGFVSHLTPTRQVSISELASLRRPPPSEP